MGSGEDEDDPLSSIRVMVRVVKRKMSNPKEPGPSAAGVPEADGQGTGQGRHLAERHTALQAAPESKAQGERTAQIAG